MNSTNHIHHLGAELDNVTGLELLYKFKCTEQQTEILTACMIGGQDANRAFNQSITLKITGKLNIDSLEKALQTMVDRNDNFKMLFDIQNNQCLVVTTLPAIIKKQIVKSNQSLEAILHAEKERCALINFDLRKGPLFDASLISYGDLHYLTLTAHHVICDGWTLGLLISEIGKLYNGFQKNETEFAPALRFVQFAEAEEQYAKSNEYLEVKNFWQDVFKDFKPVPALPYTAVRPNDYSYKSNHISFPLSTKQFNSLRLAADGFGSSLLISMCTIFEVLLYRKSAVSSFVIGLPTAGQPLHKMNELMGHCVNTIPILANVNGNLSFKDYLIQRTKDYKTAFANRHITFGTVLKHIKINRGQSTLPLIPVTFNVDRELMGNTLLDGLDTQLEINKRHYSSFDMIVNVSRVGEQLTIELDYNSSLFDEQSVLDLLHQYQYLIDSLCNQPDIVIGACDLSDPQEIQKALASFNNTKAHYPKSSTVFELILEMAKSYPNQTAIAFENNQISYSELVKQVDEFAHAIQSVGLSSGMKAGVMLDRSIDMMVAMLAVMRIGAAYIPIDPIFPIQRIQYMLEDSQTSILICEDKYKHISTDTCKAYSAKELLSIEKNSEFDGTIHSNELPAYLIYTSGSTGLPKGVEMSQRSLINLLWSVKQTPGFTSNDALFALTTISFDISGLELYLPLICGGKLVLAPSDINKDGEAIINILEQHNITVLQATPATFRLLQGFGFNGKKNLKLFCGGEPLPLELAKELVVKCDSLWNLYGPTETCIWSCVKQIHASDSLITIGQPLANTDIYILDAKHRPMAVGQAGEIAIGGDGLAIGYLGKKELTNEKFIQHPYDANRKIYLTGDLGYINSNDELVCLGRNDNQVKIRGFRIETGEIESVLIQKGNFKEAVVVPKLFAKDDLRLVAFLKDFGVSSRKFKTCKNSGLQLSLIEKEEFDVLRNLLSKDLPDYMVPAMFVCVNAMPLTPNAKTDRKFLSEIDVANLLNSEKNNEADTDIWNETELAIKPIWEASLGVKNASRLDDFFSSGGHSLIAIELMHNIESQLGFKLPLSALFRKPSIAGLAELINGDSSGLYHYLVPIKPEGTNPPLYIIHGAGLEVMVFKELAQHLDANQPLYGIQAIGLSNNEFPSEHLEDIVSKYINEIKSHNPKGPYLIAGLSAGSLLAFEAARQLEKLGDKVGLLGVFDYSLESTKRHQPAYKKLTNALVEFIPRKLHFIKTLFKFKSEAWAYQKKFIKLRVNGILARLGKDIPDDDDPSLDHFYKIMDAYFAAFEKYDIKPYNGVIDLFRSEKKLYYLKDPKYLGWHPYAKKGIIVHEVRGDHDHMITGEHCYSFARTLQDAVNRSLNIH